MASLYTAVLHEVYDEPLWHRFGLCLQLGVARAWIHHKNLSGPIWYTIEVPCKNHGILWEYRSQIHKTCRSAPRLTCHGASWKYRKNKTLHENLGQPAVDMCAMEGNHSSLVHWSRDVSIFHRGCSCTSQGSTVHGGFAMPHGAPNNLYHGVTGHLQ